MTALWCQLLFGESLERVLRHVLLCSHDQTEPVSAPPQASFEGTGKARWTERSHFSKGNRRIGEEVSEQQDHFDLEEGAGK